MNKKKLVLLVVVVLLVIIGIVVGVSIFKKNDENKETKLKAIYDKLVDSQEYSFKIELNENNKTIMAKKGEQTAIDQYTDGDDGHSTTLIKDGDTYLIKHEREEYYLYKRNNVEQHILTDGLKEITDKEYTTGTEKVNGKKYSFEEYSGSTIFTSLNALNIDGNDVKTKFYFDKDNNLVYMKTTYGETEELLKVELTYSVDDSLFEIPSNYAEN